MKIKYVFTVSVYFITHLVPVVVFLSCNRSRTWPRCVLHRCVVQAPCGSPLELFMKVSSRTTCSMALARTPSRTGAFTKANLARTGKNKCYIYFISREWRRLTLACVCRLEGDGAFTDTQGRVWTGRFNGETASGLKLLHSV